MTDARDQLSHHEQMLDAQAGCAPCKLCGGAAVITDAGSGAGYHVRCSNSTNFRQSKGCLIDERSLSGWAYNIMDWWNRLHAQSATSPADEQRIAGLNRDRTDRQYMIEALVPMLGPKGREVWALWQAKGVTRIHTSWAFDPMTIAGEEVAELHLKMEVAMADAVLVDDIDAAIAAGPLIDRPCRTGCDNPACCQIRCCGPLNLENARG